MELLGEISERFRLFGELECPGMSPLYERLSLGVSSDPEVLAIAANRREGQPAPNLFFAAVHAVLAKEKAHRLARFYPDLSEDPDRGDPYPAFRGFCLERRERIEEIISVRAVQTNVVRRSALLLPAFARAIGRSARRPVSFQVSLPFSLIEIGASAGLNLYWDRYGYDYGGRVRWGDSTSPVQLTTAAQGEIVPPVPDTIVNIERRVGLDLEPVFLDSEESVSWLRALIWPERRDEAELLRRAMELVRADPPQLLSGDALDLLPEVLDAVPPESTPCIFHSHTLNQFPTEARERFAGLVREFGEGRDLHLISLESRRGQDNSELDLTSYRGGVETWEHLATCDSHGYRIRWRLPA